MPRSIARSFLAINPLAGHIQKGMLVCQGCHNGNNIRQTTIFATMENCSTSGKQGYFSHIDKVIDELN